MKVLFLFILLTCEARTQFVIRGRVQEPNGRAIAHANVFLKDGDYAGDVSDTTGEFSIVTGISGVRLLAVSMIGYERFEKPIRVPLKEPVLVPLKEQALDFKAVQVEASSYTAGEGKVTLSKIDVYTTPGGAADVFQSLKALPGVAQTDESAALPVRGGNPSEVLVLFNHAAISHPYRAENTQGVGLFSIVETATIKRLYFSSGGFSSKYGNALSGVLDIESDPRITANRYQFDANLASLGMGIQRVLIKDRISGHFYVKKTFTDLLFKVNEPPIDVVTHPSSVTATGILNYTYSASGLLQLTTVLNHDDQEFNLPMFANNARYSNESRYRLVALTWSDIPRKNWLTKVSIAQSVYRQNLNFEPWSRDNSESVWSARWDNTFEVNRETLLCFGGESAVENYRFDASLPFRPGEFYKDGDSALARDARGYAGVGMYAELQHRLFYRTTAFAGTRADYRGLSERWTNDVRLGIARELSRTTFLRLAVGSFHQSPDVWYDGFRSENRRLQSMRARHVVASVEDDRGTLHVRLEVYGKWYDRLLTENNEGRYVNDGSGHAYGADLFIKKNIGRTSGWISYSAIRTRRKEMNVPSLRPTAHDITHNVKFIQKTRLGKGFEAASTFHWATGRPFTPVLQGDQQPSGSWRPVYGSFFGDRMPDFTRLDARLSRFTFFGEGHFVVVYIEALNILDRKNLLAYSYSEDFSSRNGVPSYFAHRTVVFGISLSY